MPWFILGVCLLVAALLGMQWFVSADPKKLATTLRLLGIVAVVGLVGALVATRQVGLLIPLALVALGLLRRRGGFGFSGMGFPGMGGARPASGQTTEAETDWLAMSLDHDTGEMGGRVKQGPFSGRQLSELSFEELLQLLADCQHQDEQAVTLLTTYLDRTQGAGWRERADYSGQGTGARAGSSEGDMSQQEAYEILGLEPGAREEDIKEAHHRLIKQVHPDQGGSDYLARKINQAKDLLLAGRRRY